jgi:hypothetical protein
MEQASLCQSSSHHRDYDAEMQRAAGGGHHAGRVPALSAHRRELPIIRRGHYWRAGAHRDVRPEEAALRSCVASAPPALGAQRGDIDRGLQRMPWSTPSARRGRASPPGCGESLRRRLDLRGREIDLGPA